MFVDFLIGAYMLVFVLAQLFPFVAQPPIGYVTSFFLVRDPVSLGITLAILIFFLRGFEGFERTISTKKFMAAYFLAAMVGNLGLFHIGAAEEALGAKGGIMGLMGLIVALHPYEIVFEFIVPLPAIVAALFLIGVKFMIEGSFEVVPLLVGMMLGYLWKERIEHPRQPKEPAGPAWRR
jgi:membrane associated rhomboid family serine protease